MGREAIVVAHWQGEHGEVKVLLESTEIVLRGGPRARIPRSDIAASRVDGATLIVDTAGGGPLVLELGETEAAKWLAVLQKPVPTLADKLGVGVHRLAFIVGKVDDPALVEAIGAAIVTARHEAALVIAVLRSVDDLDESLVAAGAEPSVPVWCVVGKGKNAPVTDAEVRSRFRAAGFVDTKTSAVSDRWTATRYTVRR